MIVDMLERPIKEGDFVVYYNKVYRVGDYGNEVNRFASIPICLIDKTKSTKTVKKPAADLCLLDREEVMIWKLKRGY